MITKPMDALEQFPVRKSKRQKYKFRMEVQIFAEKLGYPVRVEKGSFGVRNLVIGNPISAKYLVTAHYDTCAWSLLPNFFTPMRFGVYLLYQLLITAVIFAVAFVLGWGTAQLINPELFVLFSLAFVYLLLFLMMFGPANRHNANDNTSGVVTLLEIMKSMPEKQREKVCFVLFDLEEAGLLGSAAYRKAHKLTTNRQIVLNLDCVGDGDDIVLFPSAKMRKTPEMMKSFHKLTCHYGSKCLWVHSKGFAFCPSDHLMFPYGVGIMSFHSNKLLGLYCNRIHTHRDTILKQSNVNILRAALITLISLEGGV